MVCLDSDVIIDFLNNRKEVVKKILYFEGNGNLVTTSINIFEILIGLSKFSKYEEGYQFINNLKILDFDFKASEKASEIFLELKAKGKLIDQLDLFIASIAMANNEPILTRNIEHFKRIPGIKLEDI